MDNHFRGAFKKEMARYGTWIVLVVLCCLTGCDTEPPDVEETSRPAETATGYAGTIVALGDSLTAGLGVAETQAYPAQLARKLQADGFNYNVINAGISGETSSGARSRIQWILSSLKPDMVILETGANDGLRGIDPRLLESNLDKICSLLKSNHIEVLLAGMQMLPNLGPEYIQSFATIYPRIAQKHQILFMPFFLEGVAGDPQYNQADRIHPTAQGYRRIVDNIYPYVLKMIARHRNRAAGRPSEPEQTLSWRK
jgi:acyl-CoA thioesterase-1